MQCNKQCQIIKFKFCKQKVLALVLVLIYEANHSMQWQ